MYDLVGRIETMNKKQLYVFFSFLALFLLIITGWVSRIMKGEIPIVDKMKRNLVESVADSNIYTMARWITELGSESFLIPFTIIMGLILVVIFRDWLPKLFFAGGTLISHLLNMGIKVLV